MDYKEWFDSFLEERKSQITTDEYQLLKKAVIDIKLEL